MENPTDDEAALPTHDLFSVFEATAYNLWMAALQGRTPATQALYQRMRNPQVGDMVMEITSYRLTKKDRRGTGTLIAIEDNENRFLKKWTIQTPGGDTCDWTNADVIAIPTDVHDWFPPLNATGGEESPTNQ